MTLPTDAFTNLQHEVLGLRAVLNNLGAYVFTKDTQGRYTFANQQVCELFGQPLADIIGRDDNKADGNAVDTPTPTTSSTATNITVILSVFVLILLRRIQQQRCG